MELRFNNRKWIWTNENCVSSVWLLFDYKDADIINNLSELFKLEIGWENFNATINKWTMNPISIQNDSWIYKYKIWWIDTTLLEVEESMIKIDIFINNAISWIIRDEKITLVS